MRLLVAAFLLCCSMVIQTPAAPQFPANGKIAFTSDRDGNSEIYLMNADGSGQTRLTNNSVRDDYPTWSPDGRQIAFLRQNGGVFSINLMNADGTNVRQITTLSLVSYLFGMSWSPDGAKIAFEENHDIFTININGSNRVNLTNGQFKNYEPSWSPDGLRIAFARFLDLYASSIHTMNADGSNVKQITVYCQGYCGINSPDWSPDGGRIAFLSNPDSDSNDPSGILLVNPDGTNLQINPFGFAPKWSPDGTKIVFYYGGYSNIPSQIRVMNRDGSGLTQLTNTSPNNFHPDWQPLAPQLGFTVTRSDDRNNAACVPGDCSLREAVNAANASATDDTINFAAGLTTITLANEIVTNNAGTLAVNGTGANVLTIDGGAGTTNRIFHTNQATVTISGVTLTGGNGFGSNETYNGSGGAIFAYLSSLTLDGVHVTGNSVNRYGGGVYLVGGFQHRIINSTISGNTANGCGGIYANANLTIVNSTISRNTAITSHPFEGDGGGICQTSGSVIIVNSTISGNIASSEGGGFFNYAGDTMLRNVTITDNTAQRGGGIYQVSNYDYEVNPPLPYPATLNLGNTIVAGNTATSGSNPEIYFPYDLSNNIISAGGNLVGDSPGDSTNTGSTIAYQPTDIRDTNPMLRALQNNGGATSTHALLSGSPAIDKGINALVSPLAPVFDQRGTGFARIRDGNGDGTPTVDIGAFEVQPGATSIRKTPFDFDGDGRADFSVFRPSDRTWYLNRSQAGFYAVQFGLSTDKLAPADFDGDGKTDIAVYRDGIWYWLNSSDGTFNAVQFGLANDIPQPGDFTGDGRSELAVYRAGLWYTLDLANNQFQGVQFGIPSDKPVAADYDGDGKTDFAVVRQNDGVSTWYILGTRQGFYGFPFGTDTDKPVPADYDGDGLTDAAVFLPSEGNWHIRRSSYPLSNNLQVVNWGLASDALVPADYDGDGKADFAVYRNGIWYIRQSGGGGINNVYFGSSSDKPTNQVQ